MMAGFGPALMAQTGDANSWQNLRRLNPGRQVEVLDRKGALTKGSLAGVSDDSIAVTAKSGVAAVPRSEVASVRVRGTRHRAYTLIGLAIGAGAGVGLGAAVGDRIEYESGGDFAGMKPAIIGASGGLGGLIGAVVGSAVGNRFATVYVATFPPSSDRSRK